MEAGTDTPSVEVFAPAKLNLYLHVTGKRDDGYHLLDSLIAFADIGDVIRVVDAPDGDFELIVEGAYAPALSGEGDNLVLRAARNLAATAGVTDRGARITLTKNLPVASGIGGGSADAAATLRALLDLWAITDLPQATLAELCLGLGADVPICFHGHAAFVRGIGEDIRPAPALPPVPLVLVNPNVAVPTPPVFKARTGPFQMEAPFDAAPISAEDLAALLKQRLNGLEAPALTVAPVIGEVLSALQDIPGCLLARMSGSGATCIGLFPDEDISLEAAETLAEAHPDWWIAPGHLMG